MSITRKTYNKFAACTVSILALCSAAGTAQAADLFSHQGSLNASNKAHFLQSQNVRVNPSALHQAALEFELDGEHVTAVRSHVKKDKGTTIWTGQLQGSEADSVVLTARGNVFSGVIHKGDRAYKLSGNRNELQSLNRIDFASLDAEDFGGVPDGMGATEFTVQDTAALNENIRQDILIVYTQSACNAAGSCAQLEADITTSIAQMNQAYAESQIDLSMNVTSMRFINYADSGVSTGTALGQIRSTSDGIMDEVHGWRDEDGADLVGLIMDGTGCGTAYAPASPASAFNVTDESCMLGNRTLSHEIGHNQGALHDRDQHSGGTVGGYNYGFKRCSDGSDEDFGAPYFRTVMSYSCTGASRVGRYSNPNILFNGVPQGIDPDINAERGAFNARTLNESANYVAGFRDGAPLTPPAPPSGLSASSAGADSINLSWTDNSDNESGFALERSTDNITFAEVASLGAGTTSYTDNGLTSETTYYYRVEANNGAGASGYSNVSSAITDVLPQMIEEFAISQTLGSGTVTGGVADTRSDNGTAQRITEVSSGGPKRRRTQSYNHTYNFDVTGGSGGVILTANAYISGSEGARFDYSSDGGSNWSDMFVIDSTASSTMASYLFPVGTSGTIAVRVRDAEQAQGESVDSVSVDLLKITSNTVPMTPPAAPSNLVVGTVTSNSVALSFADNSADEAGFEVWRGTAPGVCASGDLVGTNPADVSNFTDGSAAPSTTYYYDVSAFNGGGSSAACAGEVSATTLAGSAITASATGYKVKGTQTVDMTWDGASGTNVDIVRNGSVVTATNNDGSYTDNIGAKGGGSYTYKVCETGSSTACSAELNIIF